MLKTPWFHEHSFSYSLIFVALHDTDEDISKVPWQKAWGSRSRYDII